MISKKSSVTTGIIISGVGVITIVSALVLGLSGCTSMMIGTCALPTVLGLSGAILTTIGSSIIDGAYEGSITDSLQQTIFFLGIGSIAGLLLCYAPWHIGLGSVLTASYGAGAALAIEGGIGASVGIVLGALYFIRYGEREKQSKQVLVGGMCISAGITAITFLAATILGPVLNMAIGASGVEATVMECFIAINCVTLMFKPWEKAIDSYDNYIKEDSGAVKLQSKMV